jgi:hypothetical protein
MYCIELVESKDWPQQLSPMQHDCLGKTVGLMRQMCKPIHHQGKVIILDSGFCVLQCVIELKKVGVFAVACEDYLRPLQADLQDHYGQAAPIPLART